SESLFPDYGALPADDDRGAREAAGANAALNYPVDDAEPRRGHADGCRCLDRQSTVSTYNGKRSKQGNDHGNPLSQKRPREPRLWSPGPSHDSELRVVPRGSQTATAISYRKNESSRANRSANQKLAGLRPAGRRHDLRSGELSYFNMWGCVQLARRNKYARVTNSSLPISGVGGGSAASVCGGLAASVGRFDRPS